MMQVAHPCGVYGIFAYSTMRRTHEMGFGWQWGPPRRTFYEWSAGGVVLYGLPAQGDRAVDRRVQPGGVRSDPLPEGYKDDDDVTSLSTDSDCACRQPHPGQLLASDGASSTTLGTPGPAPP